MHDFRVISTHIHNVRDFLQAKLDSEINARFLLNKHSDLFFFNFKISMRTVSPIAERNISRNLGLLFGQMKYIVQRET